MNTKYSFESHRQLMFTLAYDMRRLHDIAAHVGSSTQELFGSLLALVQSSHFAIAIVGEFKRGKSTFINALLGAEVLPADIEPCSATLNRVTYGMKPAAQVVFRAENGGAERVEAVPIEQLSEYVTKLTPESAVMSANVKEATIYYPVQFCKNNVDIIDTPGLNDDEVMTAVTFDVLPRVNAVIMVVMADAPFGESESKFLQHMLQQDHHNIMFVVTAIDRVRRQSDRERVLSAIKSRVMRTIEQYAAERFAHDSDTVRQYLERIGEPLVFGVSGYQALQARQERDTEMFNESGFGTFEDALELFLTRERGARAVADLLERAERPAITLSELLAEKISDQQNAQHQREAIFQSLDADYQTLQKQIVAQLAVLGDTYQQRCHPVFAEQVATLEMALKVAASRIIGQAAIADEEILLALRATIAETGKKAFDRVRTLTNRPGTGANSVLASESLNPAYVKICIDLPQRIHDGIQEVLYQSLRHIWQHTHQTVVAEIQHLNASAQQLHALAENVQARYGLDSTSFPNPTSQHYLNEQLAAGTVVNLELQMTNLILRLPTLSNMIREAASANYAEVPVSLLRMQSADEFKSAYIRHLSKTISQNVSSLSGMFLRGYEHDATQLWSSLRHLMVEHFDAAQNYYTRIWDAAKQEHERNRVACDLKIKELVKLRDDVDTTRAQFQQLAADLLQV